MIISKTKHMKCRKILPIFLKISFQIKVFSGYIITIIQKDIIKMESVQRSFTARIPGLKEINYQYHEHLWLLLFLVSTHSRDAENVRLSSRSGKVHVYPNSVTASSYNSISIPDLALNADALKQPGLHILTPS